MINARIFKIGKVRILTGGDNIQPAIAVQIPQGHILHGARQGALGKGHEHPAIGIARTEGNANLVGIFLRRDDVLKTIAIQIAQGKPVPAANG